jgi:hypothetical protein
MVFVAIANRQQIAKSELYCLLLPRRNIPEHINWTQDTGSFFQVLTTAFTMRKKRKKWVLWLFPKTFPIHGNVEKIWESARFSYFCAFSAWF